MKNDSYAGVICNECAASVGASMPSSHIASYYEEICEACGFWKIVTSARDFRFPKVKKLQMTEENKGRVLEELRLAKVRYSSQGNADASDEIGRKITEILDHNG